MLPSPETLGYPEISESKSLLVLVFLAFDSLDEMGSSKELRTWRLRLTSIEPRLESRFRVDIGTLLPAEPITLSKRFALAVS